VEAHSLLSPSASEAVFPNRYPSSADTLLLFWIPTGMHTWMNEALGSAALISVQVPVQRLADLFRFRRRQGGFTSNTKADGDTHSNQVFIWKVPENFTVWTDAEEPADVVPVARLSGHMRFVTRMAIPLIRLTIIQEGRTRPLQPCRRERPCLLVWRLHRQGVGCRGWGR
jgi:hypothetical protein